MREGGREGEKEKDERGRRERKGEKWNQEGGRKGEPREREKRGTNREGGEWRRGMGEGNGGGGLVIANQSFEIF